MMCDAPSSKMSSMSLSTDNSISVCANCGKGEEESGNLKACTACKLVKYCNRECQIAHRPQHKKECRRRASELHDEKLFKQPPPEKDCPICFLRMPCIAMAQVYMACCGKAICCGCIHAFQSKAVKKSANLCPFCRTPAPNSDKKVVETYMKRMELNDARAIYNIGGFYSGGEYGLPQNHTKALELYHQAAELGNTESYYNIGNAYRNGEGVDVDMKKAIYYYELAAMDGVVEARHNLGAIEQNNKGNVGRALQHYMINVENGLKESLDCIKVLYKAGCATKDDYTKALRLYQAYLDEIKSDKRDEAAAFNADWKYS